MDSLDSLDYMDSMDFVDSVDSIYSIDWLLSNAVKILKKDDFYLTVCPLSSSSGSETYYKQKASCAKKRY